MEMVIQWPATWYMKEMASDIRYTVMQFTEHKLNNRLKERKISMMKETYEAAEMEIIEFETEDVITTSGIGGVDDSRPGA